MSEPRYELATSADTTTNYWVRLRAAISGFVGGAELLRLVASATKSGIANAIYAFAPICDYTITFLNGTSRFTAGTTITYPNYVETLILRLTAAISTATVTSVFLPKVPQKNQRVKFIPQFKMAVTFKASGGGVAIPCRNPSYTIATGAEVSGFYTGTAYGWFMAQG